MTSYK